MMGDIIKPMTPSDIFPLKTELINILRDLSEMDDVELEKQYDRLVDRFHHVYDTGYRHMYSEIGQFVSTLDMVLRDNLSENIEHFRTMMADRSVRGITTIDGDRLYEIILKLSDHISLEIQREALYEELSSKMDSYSTIIKESEINLNKEITSANEKYKEALASVEKLKEQIVAVLGVFSAIIVAVSAGTNFLISTTESIGGAGTSQALFIISLCAMLIFNLVYLLFVYIDRILHRNEPIKPLKKRIDESAYVIAFNAILGIISILGFVGSYYLD